MRNRWFHRPLLHVAGAGEKRAGWLELFYDLVFVAATIQLGDALSHGIDEGHGAWAFLQFVGHFTPVWLAWVGVTFFMNRFDVDDFLHRVLVFSQMFLVGGLAIAAPGAMEGDPGDLRLFELTYAGAQALVAAMYLRAWKHQEVARDYSVHWGSVFAVGAAVWTVAAFVPAPWTYLLWTVGVLMLVASPLHPRARALADAYPLDQHHLSERFGLLVIIVLGESFVKVLSYLVASDHGTDLDMLGKGAFNLVITMCLWWIYFDDVAGSRLREGFGRWVLWFVAHLPVALSVTAVGVAVKYAVKIDLMAVPSSSYRWALTGSLGAALVSVAVVDMVTHRRQAELSDAWRVRVRLASAALVVLVGAVGSGMTGGTFLVLVATVMVAQVAVDLMMAPMEQSEPDDEDIITTAELARRIGTDAEVRSPTRPFADPPVRRGLPDELRQDLYFFLIEGSWTRLMALLGGGFVLLNVVFAGLYLLEDGAIVNGDGFFDALAFSVQTMSTIGYGVLSPGTPWSDTVVMVEAATGLLLVAFATGLMFAKASRPTAKVLFAANPVVTTWHGRPTLVLRVGNGRGNEILDAQISVSILMDDVSPEGHHLRTVVDLPLERDRAPLFRMTFTVRHVITPDSPLADVDWTAPGRKVLGLICIVRGFDATYAQTVTARHIWEGADMRPGHHFTDIVGMLADGRLIVDFDRFHEIAPDDAPLADVSP